MADTSSTREYIETQTESFNGSKGYITPRRRPAGAKFALLEIQTRQIGSPALDTGTIFQGSKNPTVQEMSPSPMPRSHANGKLSRPSNKPDMLLGLKVAATPPAETDTIWEISSIDEDEVSAPIEVKAKPSKAASASTGKAAGKKTIRTSTSKAIAPVKSKKATSIAQVNAKGTASRVSHTTGSTSAAGTARQDSRTRTPARVITRSCAKNNVSLLNETSARSQQTARKTLAGSSNKVDSAKKSNSTSNTDPQAQVADGASQKINVEQKTSPNSGRKLQKPSASKQPQIASVKVSTQKTANDLLRGMVGMPESTSAAQQLDHGEGQDAGQKVSTRSDRLTDSIEVCESRAASKLDDAPDTQMYDDTAEAVVRDSLDIRVQNSQPDLDHAMVTSNDDLDQDYQDYQDFHDIDAIMPDSLQDEIAQGGNTQHDTQMRPKTSAEDVTSATHLLRVATHPGHHVIQSQAVLQKSQPSWTLAFPAHSVQSCAPVASDEDIEEVEDQALPAELPAANITIIPPPLTFQFSGLKVKYSLPESPDAGSAPALGFSTKSHITYEGVPGEPKTETNVQTPTNGKTHSLISISSIRDIAEICPKWVAPPPLPISASAIFTVVEERPCLAPPSTPIQPHRSAILKPRALAVTSPVRPAGLQSQAPALMSEASNCTQTSARTIYSVTQTKVATTEAKTPGFAICTLAETSPVLLAEITTNTSTLSYLPHPVLRPASNTPKKRKAVVFEDEIALAKSGKRARRGKPSTDPSDSEDDLMGSDVTPDDIVKDVPRIAQPNLPCTPNLTSRTDLDDQEAISVSVKDSIRPSIRRGHERQIQEQKLASPSSSADTSPSLSAACLSPSQPVPSFAAPFQQHTTTACSKSDGTVFNTARQPVLISRHVNGDVSAPAIEAVDQDVPMTDEKSSRGPCRVRWQTAGASRREVPRDSLAQNIHARLHNLAVPDPKSDKDDANKFTAISALMHAAGLVEPAPPTRAAPPGTTSANAKQDVVRQRITITDDEDDEVDPEFEASEPSESDPDESGDETLIEVPGKEIPSHQQALLEAWHEATDHIFHNITASDERLEQIAIGYDRCGKQWLHKLHDFQDELISQYKDAIDEVADVVRLVLDRNSRVAAPSIPMVKPVNADDYYKGALAAVATLLEAC